VFNILHQMYDIVQGVSSLGVFFAFAVGISRWHLFCFNVF